MNKASILLKLLKTNCDFWSVVTRLRFSCIRAEAFRTWKIGIGKSWQRKSPDIAKNHEMYWNIIVYPFNCLSWSILTQRDENMDTQLLIAIGV